MKQFLHRLWLKMPVDFDVSTWRPTPIPDDAATSGPTYIAGPMTGYADHNYPAFNNMAERLRDVGFQVINPAEIHPDTTHPWDWYLRRDITELVKCSRVVFLPGWFDSKGARLEHKVAAGLGLDLVFPPDVESFIRGVQRDGCRGCRCADEDTCCRDSSGRDHA